MIYKRKKNNKLLCEPQHLTKGHTEMDEVSHNSTLELVVFEKPQQIKFKISYTSIIIVISESD